MSTPVKYHLGRNGQVAPCEASVKPCPLGGIHYSTKEEAQYDLMDLNVIRNHWRTGGMPGDAGWHCTCGWSPDDTTFSGLAKVNAHADEAHALEVEAAKEAWERASGDSGSTRVFDEPTPSFNRFDGSWIGEFSADPHYAYGILQREGGQIRNMSLEDARRHAAKAEAEAGEFVVKYNRDGEIDESWNDSPEA